MKVKVHVLPDPNKPYSFCGRKATWKKMRIRPREPVWPSGKAGKQKDSALSVSL